jgi:hypothetical protein
MLPTVRRLCRAEVRRKPTTLGWVSSCPSCGWSISTGDNTRASREADKHTKNTGHSTNQTGTPTHPEGESQ